MDSFLTIVRHVLLPVLGLAVTVSLMAFALYWWQKRRDVTVAAATPNEASGADRDPAAFGVLLALASVGALLGVAAGASRTPLVGDVLPIVISVMSGASVFALEKLGRDSLREVMPFGAMAICLTTAASLFWGSNIRAEKEQYEHQVASQEADFKLQQDTRSKFIDQCLKTEAQFNAALIEQLKGKLDLSAEVFEQHLSDTCADRYPS